MSANSENVRLFKLDLGAFGRKVNLNVKIAIQLVALDTFNRLTLRTPVDTGRARASWDLKVANASEFIPAEGEYSGPKDISAEVKRIDGKKVVFITSSLHYMKYLDEGSSAQAPAGIVDVTHAEVEVFFESIIAQLAA